MNKKINIILPGLGNSGGIIVIKKYAEMLSEVGWDVVIYSPVKAYNLHRYKSEFENLIHQIYCTIKTVLELRSKHYCKWIWSVSDQTIRNADFTMATLWATAFDVAKLDGKKGEKVYFVQDYEVWDNPALAKQTYFFPLKKIVISTWINERLEKELGIGPFPIVYNGMDENLYYKRNYVNKKCACLNFLMLNHKLEKKGVKEGITVFETIHEKYPMAQLSMFGMCDNSNVPEYVEYYQNPTKEKIKELYSSSDIFIFPSLEEGWGLTPLEAMACGCIVVGTETGFVLDLGIHEENMMISQPGDVDGMVHNIELLLEDSTLVEKIRKNAYVTVSKLNWESSRDKLIGCLLRDKL